VEVTIKPSLETDTQLLKKTKSAKIIKYYNSLYLSKSKKPRRLVKLFIPLKLGK